MGFFTKDKLSGGLNLGAPRCNQCGLHKTCLSPKMSITGKGLSKILVVAEAPGEKEDEEGVQLIGRSGQELRKHLSEAGLSLDRDCWKTNTIICRPPNNEKPTKDQRQYCFPNLLKAINELKPVCIILLGMTPIQSVVSHVWNDDAGEKIGRWVGWKIPSQKWNCWICPTWHPAYLLRQNDPVLTLWFKRHLEEASELKQRPFKEIPDYPSQIEKIHDHREAAKILRKMREKGGRIAFDYETNRLKPDGKGSCIFTCAVCWNGKKTIAYPWTGEAVKATSELLRDKQISKYGYNLKFEQRWTRAILGHDVKGWACDGMLMSHALDHRPGITSLKFQSFVRLGHPRYDKSIEPYLKAPQSNKSNLIQEADIDELLTYNGLDALFTYIIVKQQIEEVNKL